MKQPRDQRWADLLTALEEEAEEIKGTGTSTVRISFHQRQPQRIEVLERRPKYLFARMGAETTSKEAT